MGLTLSVRRVRFYFYCLMLNLQRNIPQPRHLQHTCPHHSSTTTKKTVNTTLRLQMMHQLWKNPRGQTKQLRVQRLNHQPPLIPLLQHLQQLQVPVGKRIPFLSLHTFFQALTKILLRRTDNTGPRSVPDLAVTTDFKTGTISANFHQPQQPLRATKPDRCWSTHRLQNLLVVLFHSAKHRDWRPPVPPPVCQQ